MNAVREDLKRRRLRGRKTRLQERGGRARENQPSADRDHFAFLRFLFSLIAGWRPKISAMAASAASKCSRMARSAASASPASMASATRTWRLIGLAPVGALARGAIVEPVHHLAHDRLEALHLQGDQRVVGHRRDVARGRRGRPRSSAARRQARPPSPPGFRAGIAMSASVRRCAARRAIGGSSMRRSSTASCSPCSVRPTAKRKKRASGPRRWRGPGRPCPAAPERRPSRQARAAPRARSASRCRRSRRSGSRTARRRPASGARRGWPGSGARSRHRPAGSARFRRRANDRGPAGRAAGKGAGRLLFLSSWPRAYTSISRLQPTNLSDRSRHDAIPAPSGPAPRRRSAGPSEPRPNRARHGASAARRAAGAAAHLAGRLDGDRDRGGRDRDRRRHRRVSANAWPGAARRLTRASSTRCWRRCSSAEDPLDRRRAVAARCARSSRAAPAAC